MRSLKLLAVLLLIGLFIFVGCEADDVADDVPDDVDENDVAPVDGEIRIGTLYPVSGAMALLGDESWRGAELARQKWNEEGGILGNEITFVSADAPETGMATAEAERLITNEDITVILGSYASPISTAASEVSERYGVIYFESGGIADPITERGFEYLFRVCPRAGAFGVIGMEAVANHGPEALGKDLEDIKVAVVFEDGPYGSAVGDTARDVAEELGMQVVAFEPYGSESADLSSLIERLRAADPDVLNITSYLTDAILFSEQARELGLEIPIIVGNGGGHAMSDWATAVGDDAVGWLNVDFTQYNHNWDGTPGIEEFLDRYEAEFGSEPRSGHSLMNYFGAQVLFEAIEIAGGSVDPDDLREALFQVDIPKFSTPTGLGANFNTPTQDNEHAFPVVSQWLRDEDGNFTQVSVFPEELALQDPILPIE